MRLDHRQIRPSLANPTREVNEEHNCSQEKEHVFSGFAVISTFFVLDISTTTMFAVNHVNLLGFKELEGEDSFACGGRIFARSRETALHRQISQLRSMPLKPLDQDKDLNTRHLILQQTCKC